MTNQNNRLLGYRVQTVDGNYVVQFDYDYGIREFEPEDVDMVPPCTRGEAYRIVGDYLDEYPDAPVPSVFEVYRDATPLEKTGTQLADVLLSLCERNGLDLGMSKDAIEQHLMKELVAFGAKE